MGNSQVISLYLLTNTYIQWLVVGGMGRAISSPLHLCPLGNILYISALPPDPLERGLVYAAWSPHARAASPQVGNWAGGHVPLCCENFLLPFPLCLLPPDWAVWKQCSPIPGSHSPGLASVPFTPTFITLIELKGDSLSCLWTGPLSHLAPLWGHRGSTE